MFYSETLLAKTGPLARVWLAANLERKLTKQNVLTSNLEDNVRSIIAPGQAPMALRLSGQLLLGVVKIYSRKAGYLVEDCQDVLNKIKSAFRPGNVDLAPSNTAANPNALILPDAVTELDLFAPLPDPEELLRGDEERRAPGRDPTLLDFGTSQFLLESQTPSRKEKRTMQLEDIDIGGIDFGLGDGDQGERFTPMSVDRSIEIGRRAPSAARDDPTLLDNDINLGLDFGNDDDTTLRQDGMQPPQNEDVLMIDDGYQLNGDDDIAANNAAAFARAEERAEERNRDGSTPLSELSETFQIDLNETEDTTMHEARAAQRIKRRKVMQQDAETQLRPSQIKKQQEDRSAITKQPQFLPRDPVLLQLMEMQRQGQFVSRIMGQGALEGWAPELRGILSLEVVRKAGEKKRKRDSGIADLDEDEDDGREKSPRLELPEEEDEGIQTVPGADFLHSDGLAPPMSDGIQLDFNDPQDETDYQAPFDTTEAPLLHPSQAGPVSLGTKTAVHLLREFFAPHHPKDSREPPMPSKRVKAEAHFQRDLCPEATTSRADATKMFFEMLVLGTKDAVKVEQESSGSAGELGGMIRVRGKRGLWGEWADMGGSSQAQQPVEA